MIAAVRAAAPPAQMFQWQGEVLGALSELTLWHTDAALCRRTIVKILAEIARYERIFSLYRPDLLVMLKRRSDCGQECVRHRPWDAAQTGRQAHAV